ncbi:MAG: ABC transporter substrate-binding protein [Calditrichales bacterium]|nr:MAG: ABC transporter substrate-binding protein [Calditrichales bacterium]
MYKSFSIIIACIHILSSILFAQTDTEPVRGDRLKSGYVFLTPVSFNPMITRTAYEKEINQLVFGEGLFARAAEGYTVRGLALSSEREQPRIWRVNLRSNIFFHDGSEITAADVKFTFDLYKKFAFQSHHLFPVHMISTVDVIHDKSLRIILKRQLRDFRETIGQLPILPEKNYKQWLDYNLLSSLPQIFPIGHGYYRFSRILGQEIRLDVFPEYHRQPGNLNGVDFLLYDNYEQMVDAFIENKIDLIPIQGKTTRQKIYRLSTAKEIVSVEREDRKLYYILLNTKRYPFQDVKVRRAMNYAINKKLLVSRYLESQGEVALNLLDENSPYFFSEARIFNYDPLQSLEILMDNGFRQRPTGKLFQNDRELTFEFYYQEGSLFEETIARLISINLAELGINVIPQPKNPAELERLVDEGEFEAVLRNFTYDPETPAQALREFYLKELKSENGFRNFNDRVMNGAITQSEKVYTIEQLIPIMKQMQVQINQQSPCIFLFFEKNASYAINDRFQHTKNTIYQNLEYVLKVYPKNEWFVPKTRQKY